MTTPHFSRGSLAAQAAGALLALALSPSARALPPAAARGAHSVRAEIEDRISSARQAATKVRALEADQQARPEIKELTDQETKLNQDLERYAKWEGASKDWEKKKQGEVDSAQSELDEAEQSLTGREARLEEAKAAEEEGGHGWKIWREKSDSVRDLERSVGRAESRIEHAKDILAQRKETLAAAGKDADRDRKRVETVHAQLEKIHGELEPLQAAAKRAALAADASEAHLQLLTGWLATLDQHRVEASSPAERSANRLAREQAQAFSAVVSKPGQVSQDAVAMNPAKGLYAIADGMTKSSAPEAFAQALVRRFTENPPAGKADFARWLEGAQADWRRQVGDQAEEGAPAKWFQHAGNRSAASTFLGVRLAAAGRDGTQRLNVLARGDSTLFVLRDGELIHSFPQHDAAQFGSNPSGFTTNEGKQLPILAESYELQPGDRVLGATDALSKWIFTELEAGREPFRLLDKIGSPAHLSRFVELARRGDFKDASELDVDDTAFFRFQLSPAPLSDR